MWLCLQGRTRITSHVLGPVTHPEHTLGFPPASLPSPLSWLLWEGTHAHFTTEKAHYFYYPCIIFLILVGTILY